MTENTYSKVRSKVWLTPNQIDDLRSACYSTGTNYLQQRNEAIISFMDLCGTGRTISLKHNQTHRR